MSSSRIIFIKVICSPFVYPISSAVSIIVILSIIIMISVASIIKQRVIRLFFLMIPDLYWPTPSILLITPVVYYVRPFYFYINIIFNSFLIHHCCFILDHDFFWMLSGLLCWWCDSVRVFLSGSVSHSCVNQNWSLNANEYILHVFLNDIHWYLMHLTSRSFKWLCAWINGAFRINSIF